MDFVMVSGPEKMFLRHKQVMAIFMGFSCFLMGFSTSKKHSRARRAGIWGHKTPEDFVSSLSRHRSYIFALNFCFLLFFFGCLGVRPFLFLLWGAWVLGSSMVEMAVSVLLCGKSPPIMNLAEPPFKRISRLYRPQTGFYKRGVHNVPQPTGPCGIHPCGRRDVCFIFSGTRIEKQPKTTNRKRKEGRA